MSSLEKKMIDGRLGRMIDNHPSLFEGINDDDAKYTKAFTLLLVSAYLSEKLQRDFGLEEAHRCYTDGGNDGEIDSLYLHDLNDKHFYVYIFNTKYSRNLDRDKGVSGNDVIKLLDTVDNHMFETASTVAFNPGLTTLIDEVRQKHFDEYRQPNIICIFSNNGIKWDSETEKRLSNRANENFQYQYLNHETILSLEKNQKLISEVNFTHSGNFFVENLGFGRYMVGKISAQTIYEWVNKYNSKLFNKNIRGYLGSDKKNPINLSIQKSLLNETENYNFFYFNNGITIICDRFTYVDIPGKRLQNQPVTIENMQIINGAQTCYTIYETVKKNPDLKIDSVYILIRVYELDSARQSDLVDQITYAVNNQNPIQLKDLKSNDSIQNQLKRELEQIYNYNYRTKREGEHTSTESSIPSSVAAEAVFAIWRQRPDVSRFKRSELFGNYYDRIFTPELNGAQLIIAVLIFRFSDNQRRKENLVNDHPHLPYSSYFVAMLMGKILLEQTITELKNLNHDTFQEVKKHWEENRLPIWETAVERIDQAVAEEVKGTDLRKISALFRRGDLIQELLKQNL